MEKVQSDSGVRCVSDVGEGMSAVDVEDCTNDKSNLLKNWFS